MENRRSRIEDGGSKIALLQFSILYLLSSILALSASAATPSTLPTTEPWRPGPDHLPNIGVLLSPGVVPCVLHVNAMRFPLAVGTPLTAKYQWDFGDPNGKYNLLTGFNAAHFYREPGEYTITVTVTDEAGTVQSKSAHIVLAPDRRHTIYVSPGGSDLNAGTSQQSPLHSIGKACSILPDNCEILLKAGNSYDADNTLKIAKSDVLVGRYDDGPDPVVMLLRGDGQKPPHGFFSIDTHCNGVTVEHLTFDSPYGVADDAQAPKIGLEAIVARGRNITVSACTFLNVDNAVNANGSPIGLLVQNCKAPLKTGLRAYLVWTQGSDFVCLGNSAANSTREHIVRLSGVQRALIFDNDFTNLDRRPADKDDYSKGTIEMHAGAYAYIAGNHVTGGTIRVGPLGLHGEEASSATDWAVIENNTITATQIVAYSGAHHVMIRNNVIHNDTTWAITLTGPDRDGRVNSDFHILKNSAVDTGGTGAFLRVWGHIDGIELKDNSYIAPGLKLGTDNSAVVNVAGPDLTDFTSISDNTWPDFGGKGAAAEFILNGHLIGQNAWSAFPQVKQDHFADIAVPETRNK